MIGTTDSTAVERLLRPLRSELKTELAVALLRVLADEELQSRYEYLAKMNTEGRLSSEELGELVLLLRANSLLGVLKAEVRRMRLLAL